MDEGEALWVEKLLGNGGSSSIRNLTWFIHVGLTHREDIMILFILVLWMGFFLVLIILFTCLTDCFNYFWMWFSFSFFFCDHGHANFFVSNILY